ncbi:hypothetical protein HGM15179_018333, partial [Zosterops borbonicus]
DFPFQNIGMMEEDVTRKRKMAREPQAGEEEVTTPFLFSLAQSPSPAWPPAPGQPHCQSHLLGTCWGNLLPLPCGTE